MITEKNNPNAILYVGLDKCLILNIINEENKDISAKNIGNINNLRS